MKKLSLALAAVIAAGLLGGEVHALTRENIAKIREYADSGDDAGLRAYIDANPSVMNDSVLGMMLRDFMNTRQQTGFLTRVGFQNPIPAVLTDTLRRAKSDPSLY